MKTYEVKASGIIERKYVHGPMQTGLKAADSEESIKQRGRLLSLRLTSLSMKAPPLRRAEDPG